MRQCVRHTTLSIKIALPFPHSTLKEHLNPSFKRSHSSLMEKNYLQTHGTAMSNKMAVAFANIFMAVVETEILNLSALKPLVWKRYIEGIFSIWNVHKHPVTQFIEQTNKHHQTIKFTAEISYTEITFLDTNVFKGERFANKSILDIETHFKPTETFQYTHSQLAILQGSKRASSRAKHLGFSVQTTLKMDSKLKSRILEQVLLNEHTQKV